MRQNEYTCVVPRKHAALLDVVIIVLSMATWAYPVRNADADAFGKGGVRTSIICGWGHAFNDDYFILGAGAGYYVIDGLEIGLELETWLGGGFDIYKVSPEIRYVLHSAPSLKPYGGAFYRRTIIERFDDLTSVGFRAGVFHDTGNGSYLGVGVVHEIFLNCDKDVYSSCTETYPEIVFWLAF
jgi:hypothetical protein